MQTQCHLSQLVHEQAKRYGDAPVLTFQRFGEEQWKTISWNQFSLRVKQVSNALLNLGVKPQENIAVCAQNCLFYLYTDFAAYGVRAVSVPLYATSSEQQIQYVVNDADVRLLFVGEQAQYDRAIRISALCPTLERIIIFDSSVKIHRNDGMAMYFEDFIKLGENLPRQSELETRWKDASDEDLCNILYTSGTTGESKGVMLTYAQYAAGLEANAKCVPVNKNDRVINFLPFTHIFERAWAYLALSVGAQLIINTDPRNIQQAMKETHPTCMSAVPRFWEKVYAGVQSKIEKANGVQRTLFERALAVGKKHNVDYPSRGKSVPLAVKLEYSVLNKTVLSLVRKQLGLENAHIFPTAGATISPDVECFVKSIGLEMMTGYGLTESLATVSCDHVGKPFTLGSVGRLIDGLQIKFSDNNEILLKGPTITKGYYKKEAENKRVFDEEGFFKTGDAGYMRNGELFLTGRIKELYKTSNGKYIAPAMVEALLLVDKFIDQVAVVADGRKFVSALIVPDFKLLEEYAKDQHINYTNRQELCAHEQVVEMIGERINTLQQQLAQYEQIKRVTILPKAFSMDAGELTNTLKLRRKVILENYKSLIDKMYEE